MKKESIMVMTPNELRYHKSKTDWERIKKMTEREIIANAKSDPDNPLLTKKKFTKMRRVYHSADVKSIRQKLQVSQELFALYFGVSKRTLQEWEQGRRLPSGAARTLLIIIARRPEVVKEILRGENEAG